MELLTKMEERKRMEEIYKELDSAIGDMEHGRTIPHDETMQLVKERMKSYGV